MAYPTLYWLCAGTTGRRLAGTTGCGLSHSFAYSADGFVDRRLIAGNTRLLGRADRFVHGRVNNRLVARVDWLMDRFAHGRVYGLVARIDWLMNRWVNRLVARVDWLMYGRMYRLVAGVDRLMDGSMHRFVHRRMSSITNISSSILSVATATATMTSVASIATMIPAMTYMTVPVATVLR